MKKATGSGHQTALIYFLVDSYTILGTIQRLPPPDIGSGPSQDAYEYDNNIMVRLSNTKNASM